MEGHETDEEEEEENQGGENERCEAKQKQLQLLRADVLEDTTKTHIEDKPEVRNSQSLMQQTDKDLRGEIHSSVPTMPSGLATNINESEVQSKENILKKSNLAVASDETNPSVTVPEKHDIDHNDDWTNVRSQTLPLEDAGTMDISQTNVLTVREGFLLGKAISDTSPMLGEGDISVLDGQKSSKDPTHRSSLPLNELIRSVT